jgi:hypothetical protein
MRTTEKKTGLFERLKTGLEEGVRFAKGELTLRTTMLVKQEDENVHHPQGTADTDFARRGDSDPPNDNRLRLLRRLRRRRFMRIRFRGLDAVVAEVSDASPPPPAVQAKIDEGPPQRWYPIEGGGYLVRWPHTSGAVTADGLRFDPGGWDHEHCDGCNRPIWVGQTFWQTARGSCFWLCPYCYRRLRQLQDAEPGAHARPRKLS